MCISSPSHGSETKEEKRHSSSQLYTLINSKQLNFLTALRGIQKGLCIMKTSEEHMLQCLVVNRIFSHVQRATEHEIYSYREWVCVHTQSQQTGAQTLHTVTRCQELNAVRQRRLVFEIHVTENGLTQFSAVLFVTKIKTRCHDMHCTTGFSCDRIIME
jgi:hypothetical protein